MSLYADYLSRSRFNSLDGLRALSVLAVIWHHTEAAHFEGWRSYFGSMGMNMFFAISGFLITTLLIREWARHGQINFRAFYMRRVLRIFPLYYGTLLVYVILVGLLERNSIQGQAFFNNLPYFLTFTSNIFVPLENGRIIFYFSWSVATEEQFYLIWPWVLALCASYTRAGWLLAAVLVVLVSQDFLTTPGFKIMPIAIVGGSLLALVLHTPRGYAAMYKLVGASWAASFWAVVLLLSMVLEKRPPALPHFIMVLLVVSCAIREDHSLQSFLNWKPLVYLGTISYGLYMLHMLCKNIAVKILGVFLTVSDLPVGVVFFATTLLSIVFAALSFRYFESYFLSLKHRYQH